MLRDARIRTKLIAIFVLPALGTTVLLPARLLDGPAEGPGPGPAARRPAGPVWAALKQLPRRVTEPELAGEP